MTASEELSTRTFGNEDGLPRVPLPTLEQSCERFLEWCAPLLDADGLAATQEAVGAYLAQDSGAHTLHAALERYEASDGVHSWLDTFWPYRYLGRRDRIALNANFFFLFKESGQQRLERAADLVARAVDYKLRLDEQSVPPATQRGRAQSMEQHKYLFSATRIPGEELDSTRLPYSADWPGPSTERHIVVFFRGAMFRLEVIAADGDAYGPAELEAALRAIVADGTRPDSPVGHLTTKARAEWARTRRSLRSLDPANEAAVDTVEKALFCLCLDDLTPADTQDACAQLLHGDSGNRWFDKAVSLLVFNDGTAGINVEHCELDGTTILSFVDAVLDESAAPPRSAEKSGRTPGFRPIEFVLDDTVRAEVAAAGESFAEFAAATATSLVSFPEFGADRAKQLGFSPDSFVQMAYQLAHKRAKGLVGATYESIATRQYRHGRTEAMRVVTPQILEFVEAMDDPGADAETRRSLFRAAADKHVARAKECQSGQAPEQHLWELQLIQRRRGEELGVTEPFALYDSPGWTTMRDDYLSTSSAPSKNIRYFGFGSTATQCIGIAYVLLPDRLNLHLSTPRAVSAEMATFAEELRTAIAELQDLVSDKESA